MKKRELLERIEDLERRLAAVEQRTSLLLPIAAPPTYVPSTGTGTPLPQPPTIVCCP